MPINKILAIFVAASLANPAFAQPTELRGRVDAQMIHTVRDAINSGVRDFTINSSLGGYVMIAAVIAGLMRAHNASITVNGLCASACALLVIGVQDKRYTSEAIIEIHGARYAYPSAGQDADAPARAAASYMIANGVPERIAYGPGMGVNPYQLSEAELNRIGFTTAH